MLCRVRKKDLEDLESTGVFPQTPFWGRIKRDQGFEPRGFEMTVSRNLLNDQASQLSNLKDDLLVLIRRIGPDACYAYVPYGPKLEPTFENQGTFLENLSEMIRPHLPGNCVFLRFDLMWENQWAAEPDYFDTDGNWYGAPEERIQEYRVNFKTNNWNLRKSPGDSLPKNTFFLDLSANEQDLLGRMRSTTRYNIRKALSHGVEVQEYGLEQLDEWYRLYTETALRHGMVAKNREYFSTILNNQDNNKRGVTVKMLMAGLDGTFFASLFLLLSKTRGTYLYGASTVRRNQLMASYALQWESIRQAKKWDARNTICSDLPPVCRGPILFVAFMFLKKVSVVTCTTIWVAGIIHLIKNSMDSIDRKSICAHDPGDSGHRIRKISWSHGFVAKLHEVGAMQGNSRGLKDAGAIHDFGRGPDRFPEFRERQTIAMPLLRVEILPGRMRRSHQVIDSRWNPLPESRSDKPGRVFSGDEIHRILSTCQGGFPFQE